MMFRAPEFLRIPVGDNQKQGTLGTLKDDGQEKKAAIGSSLLRIFLAPFFFCSCLGQPA